MRRLEIYLFAPFRVVVDGTAISQEQWQGRVPRSLLKVLALSRHGCTSDQLLDLFWPDYPLAQARQRLYEAMSRLRRTLTGNRLERPPGSPSNWPIETFASGYRLAESTWVDVRAFHDRVSVIRQLRATDPEAAVRMLLDEERPDPDALLADEPYADWAVTARERVYDDVRLLEEMKVDLLLEHGRPLDALDALQALFEMDPTSEETGSRAIEVAWQLGRRQTATAIFHRMQQALLDELGVEPSEETLALYQRISDARPRTTALDAPLRATQLVATSSVRSAAGTGAVDLRSGAANGPGDETGNDMDLNFSDAFEDRLLGQPPAYLTRFVGREPELIAVADALHSTRLLTLHGTGGTGKTRLAWEVVTHLRKSCDDAVCWIDLAAVHDGRLLPQTLAAALLIRKSPGLALLDSVCEALKGRTVLLVLDNCEHLAPDAARVVETLLQACPGLRIMATSQVALGVPGEKIYPVPPLSVPDETDALDIESIARHASVALFVDRAVAIRNGFRLTSQNAASVARICRRLNGNPLAIELAAAKLSTLTPNQIANRLDQRFQLLQRGPSVGPARHRSLRALIDWTYGLLPELERKLWERLSVFAGDFSLETVEALFADGPDAPANNLIFDAVCRLVERSILVAEESGREMRYRLLETMREYGALKLALAGEERDAKQRHLHWCLRLVQQGTAAYCRRDELEWLERLGIEYDQIRTALDWAIAQGDSDASLQLVGSLWWFWVLRGWVDEGRTYTEMALAAAGDRNDKLYAMALHTMGPLHLWLGDSDTAKTYLLRCVDILDKAGDSPNVALAHLSLGIVLIAEGDLNGAEKALRTCLAVGRRVHDESNVATALWHLGNVSLEKGDLIGAKELFHESLLMCRHLGYERGEVGCLGGLGMLAFHEGHEPLAVRTLEEGIALSRRLNDHVFGSLLMDYLGWMARRRGDYGRALSLHQESLQWRWRVRDRTGAADTLGHLAETALCLGQHERAARLFGATQSWTPSGAASLPLPYSATLDRGEAFDRLKSALPSAAMEAATMEGRLMRPDDVVAYALSGR